MQHSSNQQPNDRQGPSQSPPNDLPIIMEVELLNIQGHLIPHYVVPINGDGSCLFRAISFLIFHTQRRATMVRKEIATYVVNNWHSFRVLSHDSMGDNYTNETKYWFDMSKPYTYGGLCELIAAGQIYPFCFEVYRNGQLYTQAGQPTSPVRRLRFTADLSAGHFDVYKLKDPSMDMDLR